MLLQVIFLVNAHATALAPIPPAPTAHLPIETGGAPYTCDQIQAKLETYNTMTRQQDSSVTDFLGQVTGKMGEWYLQLKPLEGTAPILPKGTFLPLQEGAAHISNITDLAYDNTALLAQEMDRILKSLKDCLKPAQNK